MRFATTGGKLFPFALLLCFAVSVAAQETAPVSDGPIQKAVMAKQDSEGNIVEDVTEFSPTDKPHICYIDMADGNTGALLVKFIATKAVGLRANTVIYTGKYTITENDAGAVFEATMKNKFPVGDYRVEISFKGKLEKTLEYKVK
ncbi:MAG: hypothetical protein R2684_04295 [Pyrinomonadaceae bacterium]